MCPIFSVNLGERNLEREDEALAGAVEAFGKVPLVRGVHPEHVVLHVLHNRQRCVITNGTIVEGGITDPVMADVEHLIPALILQELRQCASQLCFVHVPDPGYEFPHLRRKDCAGPVQL